VKEARLAAKKSQGDVARYLNVTVTYVSDVENGKRTPYTRGNTIRVAHFLEADSQHLLMVRGACMGSFDLPVMDSIPVDGLAARLSSCWERLTDKQRTWIAAALEVP
jgi:transcriptional regulator with XRE-family HTH domain